MKKLIFFLFFLIPAFSYAQAVLDWANGLQGPGDNDFSRAIAIDPLGNVYTTGYFCGTVDFDPGPATFNLTAAGASSATNTDIFVLKLDHLGNFIWAKRIGGSSNDGGWAIALDAAGNVIVGGHFRGTVDFNPATAAFTMTSSGAEDAFVLKLDSSGNFVWAKRYGNAYSDYLWSLTTDGANNIYAVGSDNAFIIKYDELGNIIWLKSFGPYENVTPFAIKLTSTGSVIIGGHYQEGVDFDPGSGVFNLSTPIGVYYTFVMALDASGNFLWAKSLGDGSPTTSLQGLTIDLYDNIYCTGTFMGNSADFDPGPGVYSLSGTFGSDDSFICKLDPSGNLIWAKNLAGDLADVGRDITTDASGNVLATGVFSGTMAFNPGSSLDSIYTIGRAVYLLKLSPSGYFMWVRIFALNGGADVFSLQVDYYNNIYLAGLFSATSDFDPGSGIVSLTPSGWNDAFILKLHQSFNSVLENTNTLEVTAYPNPSSGIVTIHSTSTIPIESVEVFNSSGAMVYDSVNSKSFFTIDLTNQPAGIYFIKVMSDNKIIGTQKIIKE